MQHIIILLLLVTTALFSYEDNDFDGVADHKDQCLNTPVTDLTDQHGCSIVKIMNNDPIGSRYDIILGYAYDSADYGTTQDLKTLRNTFQADVFMDDWSVEFYTSYYVSDSNESESSGMNDTTLTLYYGYQALQEKNVFVRVGLGTALPTKKNSFNKMDYIASLSASYIIKNYSIFLGYKYTLIGDENSEFFKFQNTESLNFGLGYYIKANIYTSLSYLNEDHFIKDIEKIKNISFYLFYGINNNWFATGSYSKGLSDTASDLSSSLRIGYYF